MISTAVATDAQPSSQVEPFDLPLEIQRLIHRAQIETTTARESAAPYVERPQPRRERPVVPIVRGHLEGDGPQRSTRDAGSHLAQVHLVMIGLLLAAWLGLLTGVGIAAPQQSGAGVSSSAMIQ